jgi:hypothetical protein
MFAESPLVSGELYNGSLREKLIEPLMVIVNVPRIWSLNVGVRFSIQVGTANWCCALIVVHGIT